MDEVLRIQALEWFERSHRELETAWTLYEARGFTDAIAYHVEQAIEKALKGSLVLRGTKPPRTHEVDSLLEAAAQSNPAIYDRFIELCEKATRYYVEDRYPPGPPPDYGHEEVKADLESAEALVRELFGPLSNARSPALAPRQPVARQEGRPGIMMEVAPSVVDAAFERHHDRYASGKRAWGIPYHIRCWRTARQAFAELSLDEFKSLYEELRRRWQVFRGKGASHWSAAESFAALRTADETFRARRLSELTDDHALGLASTLDRLSGLKKTKSGASVVALSKFLHFMNPRLFVIVDRGVMWNWVLTHSWLSQQVGAVRERACRIISGGAGRPSGGGCSPRDYVAVLLWAGELVRRNPAIVAAFARYVRRYAAGEQLPTDLDEYEAAAVEWFLEGLVELPPRGVSLL